MQPAWEIETGDPGVIVAVIDTGVAYEDYEEFVDNPGRGKDYWITYQQAPDLVNTNFVAGYDFVNNDEHSNDDEGHGTHVTGTIAQSTNNAIGVAGVAFGTSIMPVKVLNSKGSGTYADIADGIYFAADNGAAVINLSLGGTSTSSTLENAVSYAYDKGVTIVCAAGNEYESGNSPLYPAAYDAYCIAVGATTYNEARAYYSNTGSYLDIAAPGGDLYADLNGDGYGDGVLQQTFGSSPTDWGYWFYQGTSMATPHVAAVAALLIANGITGPDNVRDALEATAEDKGQEGWDSEYGWGIVDAYAALNYEAEPVHDVAVLALDAPSEAYEGDLVSISVTVKNQGTYAEATTVSLTKNGVPIDSQPVSLNAGDSTIVSFDWDTTGASIADHILKAEVSTVSGETDIADNSLTTTVTINEMSTVTIYADSIEMSLSTKKAGRNIFTKALATITIMYTGGDAVQGATVSGFWSGATSDIDSGITDSFGKVTISSDEVKNASGGTTFTFTVDNVAKPGWTYDPAANIVTSKSITVP
jgi:serine protease